MADAQEKQTELSTHAVALLEVLRRAAFLRGLAITDKVLASRIGVPARELIDLADELIQAGHVVVAEVSDPKGRWLCTRAEDLTAARRYANSLGRRGVRVLRRRKVVRWAIERADLALPEMDSTGQYLLFAL